MTNVHFNKHETCLSRQIFVSKDLVLSLLPYNQQSSYIYIVIIYLFVVNLPIIMTVKKSPLGVNLNDLFNILPMRKTSK